MNIQFETAIATRRCRKCEKKIRKDTPYIIERHDHDVFASYDNYCPICSIKFLKKGINSLVKFLNRMDKYVMWDK